jgi:hypothetical protein
MMAVWKKAQPVGTFLNAGMSTPQNSSVSTPASRRRQCITARAPQFVYHANVTYTARSSPEAISGQEYV